MKDLDLIDLKNIRRRINPEVSRDYVTTREKKPARKKVGVIIAGVIGLVVVIGGIYFFTRRAPQIPGDDGVTLAGAAKIGQMQTRKLLIQVYNSGGAGGFERGDIVLVAPSDKEFSPAEKDGFLIIKMDLTDKQTELLIQARQQLTGEKTPEGQPEVTQLNLRKYSVDLNKVGIAPDVVLGREITDQVFKWDIVAEKPLAK